MNIEKVLWERFLWPIFTPKLFETSNIKNEEELDKFIEGLNEYLSKINDMSAEEREEMAKLTNKAFIIPGIPSYEWSMRIFGALFILLILFLFLLIASFFTNIHSASIILYFIVFLILFIFIGISSVNSLQV